VQPKWSHYILFIARDNIYVQIALSLASLALYYFLYSLVDIRISYVFCLVNGETSCFPTCLVCIYIYTHTHTYMYTYVYMCINMYICIHMCIYIYMCVYIYICIHIHTYVYMYVYKYIYVYIHIYVCIHIRRVVPYNVTWALFVDSRHEERMFLFSKYVYIYVHMYIYYTYYQLSPRL
jgi:hypothetical protein